MAQLTESENHISQQLHTLTSCSWQEQIEVIKALKVTPQLIKLINHRNYSAELATLFASHNPRTKLITALTEFLLELFANFANQLIPFANLLISSECLIRLLGSGNKVISSSANEIMKCIIGNIDYKSKGKAVKFVVALEQEFLNSKNQYVREKISLYFLLISTSFYYATKETLGDFEKKIVKEGLQDASEKVRANMRQILQNIHHFEKENDFVELQKQLSRKSTDKVTIKSTKMSKVSQQNKSLRVLNSSSMNQSIMQSFVQQDKLKPAIKDTVNEQSYVFYLQRLRTSTTWSMILIAYESLLDLINRGFLSNYGEDGLYCETIKVLTPFLNEKRSKIYQSCADIFCSIFEQAKSNKKDKIIAFCQENAIQIIESSVKNEYSALKILPSIIVLNPSFFIAKISQISMSSKVYKEKCLLLDSIVTNLQKILQEQSTGKGNKRITAMVKAMCFHIQSSSLKEKQISLASLAVISQLKSKYSQEVLTALLCQSDKSLTKILQLAESIDPSLKKAIIDYINSFKASSKKSHTSYNNKENSERRYISQLIQKEICLISQQKAMNLYKLGELILTHITSIDCKQFKRLLSLVQYLCNADLIMQYKILMEEISRQSNQQFLTAIVEVLLTENTSDDAKIRQFHDILLLQILQIRMSHIEEDSIDLQKIVNCLLQVYRASESLKKRNKCIQLLTRVRPQHLSHLSENERLLVDSYRQSLNEQEDFLSL